MLDTLFATCNNPVTQYLCTGQIAKKIGNEHPQDVPWGDFPTADGMIIIACGRTNTYRDLCKVLDCMEYVDDPRFCNDEVRLIHKEECHEIVGHYTALWKTEELIEALTNAGVPCSTVNTIDKACKDKSILARHMIINVTHKTAGNYQMPGTPLKFKYNPVEITKGAPILGENNREIFGKIGLNQEEIEGVLNKQKKVRTLFPEFALE